jgi:LacI family transcriptional regulator
MAKSKSKIKNVTSHDVAKRAGVSQATVSLAMRGSDQVSKERIEQIRKIAQEMGYFPRAAGQMLRNRKTGYIGLIMAAKDPEMAVTSGFMGPVMAQVVRTLSESQTPYLVDFHHHETAEHHLPRQVASGMVDGILVVGDVGSEVTEALRQKSGFPWVSIGEYSDYCVLNDATQAIDQAVQELYDLGHRRIAYAGGPDIYQEHLESRVAFEESVARRGITDMPDDWVISFFEEDRTREYANHVYQWCRQVLGGKKRPTAMICRSESISRTAVYVAAEMGLALPGDLSVISWGATMRVVQRYPCINSLVYNTDELVRAAIDLLERRMKNASTKPQTIRVPMQVLDGTTVGPCPK